MVSINELVRITSEIAGKTLKIKHISGPLGVRGRNSENTLIRKMLNWDYEMSLKDGIARTLSWINKQVENK
jgi:nucleoside-diphosphate-sugar epimerase